MLLFFFLNRNVKFGASYIAAVTTNDLNNGDVKDTIFKNTYGKHCVAVLTVFNECWQGVALLTDINECKRLCCGVNCY